MILVGGGSRSGKTRFALDQALRRGSRLGYIATAEIRDEEMRARVQAHRAERGPNFETIEEPRQLAALLHHRGESFDAIVIDCLTLWASNLLLDGQHDLRPAALELARAAAAAKAEVILITNEVGCGIVPENELARRFRDQAGWINQIMADQANEVWWMVFGCGLKVKG
ncbi:MAG: bifunctional adenosylcobinamide kinase/adenosylcobinamide-phosphate guanylyltransferase [Bryobacteraceae bacterium]|nr:bifunctional adenosylcobinamide kinase/adenosylcobinamide-phosphate guanylyltransferase [Bryobacteraceae bacterium]MDW8379343.1 bifunctional adenosylcobinamide kinase/adenosylcobinamide-phosphate guanylyltransferase [Bryobacterales bacterium]